MKKIILIYLIVATLMLCACVSTGGETSKMSGTEIVIENFMNLTKIPRQSKHEEQVSAYLLSWAKQNGFEAVSDSVNNVIVEVPASKGFENAPLTVLQAHMDMVCIAESGVAYDPLVDPIVVVNDGKTLTAKGTSLGADDGIGIAIIQYILGENIVHGPLRVIFTVDEEDGMTGAKNIDPKYFSDAKYLINLDSEEDYNVTISSAGYVAIDLEKFNQSDSPKQLSALEITLGSLKGGHSGMEINTGKINAIVAMGDFLLACRQQKINFELAEFSGGVAINAIPAQSSCVITIDKNDISKIETIISEIQRELKNSYSETEPDLSLGFKEIPLPLAVMSITDRDDLINLVTMAINGVHTMSQVSPGLVQSSSNIGILSATASQTSVAILARSSEELLLNQMRNRIFSLAELCRFVVVTSDLMPGWSARANSDLCALIEKIYKEQNGQDIEIIAVHAGLECSYFFIHNQDLDMVSIGPNLFDVHTPKERLEIASIEKSLKLAVKTIEEIAKK